MRNLFLSLLGAGILLLAGCGGSSPVALPDSPDGTANTFIQQILACNARVLWDAMPASYQKDAAGLVHQFGNKMDGEILEAGFGAIDKAVKLMESKKEFILEALKGFMGEGEEHKKLAAHWTGITQIVKAVASSDLRKADRLKNLDLGSFLGGKGSEILKHIKSISPMIADDPFAQMPTFKFEAAGEPKDGIVPVQLLKNGEKQGRPEKFQKVEGKWIFAEMAKDWPEMIAEGKKNLEGMDLSKQKAEIMKGIAQVSEVLDKLAAAKDAKEFQAQFAGAMGGFQGMMEMLPFGR